MSFVYPASSLRDDLIRHIEAEHKECAEGFFDAYRLSGILIEVIDVWRAQTSCADWSTVEEAELLDRQ